MNILINEFYSENKDLKIVKFKYTTSGLRSK